MDKEWYVVFAVIVKRHEATLKGGQWLFLQLVSIYNSQMWRQSQVFSFHKFKPVTNTNCLTAVDLWRGTGCKNEVAIVLAFMVHSVPLIRKSVMISWWPGWLDSIRHDPAWLKTQGRGWINQPGTAGRFTVHQLDWDSPVVNMHH